MRLHARQSDGTTLRQHLEAGALATGRADPRLGRRPPALLVRLWEAFCAIAGQRQVGMSACPIALAEVEAWQRMARVSLLPWEVDTLLACDRAQLVISAEMLSTRAASPKGRA